MNAAPHEALCDAHGAKVIGTHNSLENRRREGKGKQRRSAFVPSTVSLVSVNAVLPKQARRLRREGLDGREAQGCWRRYLSFSALL